MVGDRVAVVVCRQRPGPLAVAVAVDRQRLVVVGGDCVRESVTPQPTIPTSDMSTGTGGRLKCVLEWPCGGVLE